MEITAEQWRWECFGREYDHGIAGMKKYCFDCGSYNDPAKFTEAVKELGGYLQRELKHSGAAVSKTVRDQEYSEPEVPEPDSSTDQLTGIKARIWMAEWEEAKREKREYLEECKKAYHYAFKMATPAMKTRLKGSRGFEAIEDAQDVVALLNLMQGICCRSDDQIHLGLEVVQAKKRIYLYVQNYKTTND